MKAGDVRSSIVAWTVERHRVARNEAGGWSGGEHDDLVGERDRLLEVVGDEDDGLRWRHSRLGFAALGGRATAVVSQRASSSVSIRTRVCTSSALNGSSISIEAAIEDPVLRHRRALAHAAAELRGIVVGEGREADAAQPLASPRVRLRARDPANVRPSATLSRMVFHGSSASC